MMGNLSRAGSRASTPWRNGLGTTEEIFIDNDRLGMVWRLSLATITEQAEFSLFPGLHRILVPVDRALSLRVDGEWHAVGEGSPIEFEGEQSVAVEPRDGPARALNVMFRRGTCALKAETLANSNARRRLAASAVALFVASGTVRLESGDILRIGDAITVTGSGEALVTGTAVVVSCGDERA